MKNAAILWTGGKDSALAWRSVAAEMHVACLVTFVPDPPRPFLAHPLEIPRAQAQAMGIEHRAVPIAEPLAPAYEAAIDALADEGIDVLVTGDMDRVAGHDNWIVERARDRVEVVRPLWGADRIGVLRRLADENFEVVCSYARSDAFPEMVGRTFDAELIAELTERHGRAGFDACGENGEYHTVVLHAPGFTGRLRLENERVVSGADHQRLVFDAVGCVQASG